MRFLFVLGFLIAKVAISTSIGPMDEITCEGMAWGDEPIHLVTKTSGNQRELNITIGKNPILYQVSYEVKFFHSLPGSQGKGQRFFHISAHSNEGDTQYAQLEVNLQDESLGALLIMTLPENIVKNAQNSHEIHLSSCHIVKKEKPKEESFKLPPKANRSCNIL